jgi:hypothetical protein
MDTRHEIDYTTIQSAIRSFWLQFIHGDNSDWGKKFVWLLQSGAVMLIWLEFLTLFAAWLGTVSHEELGPVWLNFLGIEFRAPWAGIAYVFTPDGRTGGWLWLMRICSVILTLPGIGLALLYAGLPPKRPAKGDRFVYGGHLLDQAGSSGVIVGHAKGLPWQKMPDLVRLRPSTDILILGSGPEATAVFQAALKSFDGAILPFGKDRLFGELIDDREILRVAEGAIANFPLDPLRQVRTRVLAWGDVWAMLSPCGFNERQRVLATVLLVHGLETLRPADRTFAGVMEKLAGPEQLYARLHGWLGATEILKPEAYDQVSGLLDYWAQTQEQVAEDLAMTPEHLWATQRGWSYYLGWAPLPTLANICEYGPRILSIEIRAKNTRNDFDPVSLPLMHAITQLHILFREALTSGNRPILVALEPDMPDELARMIKAVHADLKRSGVSFLVHARSTRDILNAFRLGLQKPMRSVFDTVIMTEPNYMSFIEVVDNRAISSEGVRHVRPGEVLIAETGRLPVRLHPADPSMVRMASYTQTDQIQRPEPWSEAAASYPLGASLPKQVVVKIPKQKVTKRQELVPVPVSQDAPPNRPKSKPLVTKDDLTSGTARLKRALAKRTGGTSSSQARLF